MPQTEKRYLPGKVQRCSMTGAYALLLSGLWLLWPSVTFLPISPLYQFMAKVPGGENSWGILLILFALPRLYTESSKKTHLRLGTVIISLIGLLFIGIITAINAPQSLLMPFLIVTFFTTARSAREIDTSGQ